MKLFAEDPEGANKFVEERVIGSQIVSLESGEGRLRIELSNGTLILVDFKERCFYLGHLLEGLETVQ